MTQSRLYCWDIWLFWLEGPKLETISKLLRFLRGPISWAAFFCYRNRRDRAKQPFLHSFWRGKADISEKDPSLVVYRSPFLLNSSILRPQSPYLSESYWPMDYHHQIALKCLSYYSLSPLFTSDSQIESQSSKKSR